MAKINLIGQRFGRLVVIGEAPRRNKKTYWLCRCDCGIEREFWAGSLRNGITRSCGCLQRDTVAALRRIDVTGQRFGRLIALHHGSGSKSSYWQCICDCGKTATVALNSLKSGVTQSCGCLQREIVAERNKANARHGLTDTPVWVTWRSMHQRCYDPGQDSYHHYGGRGIKVCDRWHKFENFLEDMGQPEKGKTIDRIDVNGNYSCGHCEECARLGWKANCRWATTKEQARNRRNNVLFTFDGRTQCAAAWCEEFSMPISTFWNRLDRGWSIEKTLTEPTFQVKTYTYQGKTQTLFEWAKELGIKKDTLDARIRRRGWSVEKAFSTPTH